MRWRLLAAGVLTSVLVLVPEAGMGPPGNLELEGPTALEFEALNLVIYDQENGRRITVTPEGMYVAVRWGSFHPPQGDPSPLGAHLAWQQGLEGAEFPLGAAGQGAADQEAWADPWRSLVLWNSPRGPLVLETIEPVWPLGLLLVLWPLGCAALGLVLVWDLIRATARWLTRPAPAFRVAVVTLPLLGLVIVLIWAFQQAEAWTRETDLRVAEMTLLGKVVGRWEATASSGVVPGGSSGRGYTWTTFRVEGDRLVPRPREGRIRASLAAVRSGRVQSFVLSGRGVVVLVPIGAGSQVGALVELRWDGTRPSQTGNWWGWPLVGLGCLWTLSQTLGWVVSRPRPRPLLVRAPDRVPRRWVEAWGPDLLAPFHHRLPLVKRVVVVVWPDDAGPEWTTGLAEAGVVEVDAPGPVRRGLSPGGVAPVARLWNQGGPRWLTVEVKTVGLGLVDVGDRMVPLTTLAEPKTTDSELWLDASARRQWPKRVGEQRPTLV